MKEVLNFFVLFIFLSGCSSTQKNKPRKKYYEFGANEIQVSTELITEYEQEKASFYYIEFKNNTNEELRFFNTKIPISSGIEIIDYKSFSESLNKKKDDGDVLVIVFIIVILFIFVLIAKDGGGGNLGHIHFPVYSGTSSTRDSEISFGDTSYEETSVMKEFIIPPKQSVKRWLLVKKESIGSLHFSIETSFKNLPFIEI